ncbi:MAG: DUF2142 domain-containing protein [Ruthenibacterium sp.]
MEQITQNKKTHKKLPPIFFWAAGLCASLLACVGLVYYWRVFYSYGRYPFAALSAPVLTAVLAGITLLGWGVAALLAHTVHDFSAKAAAAIFCVGLLFAFVTPPLQEPDAAMHYLRAYTISTGKFDFNDTRGYPDDVGALFSAFNGAWTAAHGGATIKATLPKDAVGTDAAQTVHGEAISNRYLDYQKLRDGDAQTRALYEKNNLYQQPTEASVWNFTVLPMLPQAAGMAIARLFGGGALSCVYGARIGNLFVYALLCLFALRNCKRYRPLFVAFMLLPMTLFLAASCNYDGLLLGLYWFAASYYCKDEITDRDMLFFCIAYALMVHVKLNNILWLCLPLVLPMKAWKCRLKKWQAACVAVCGAVGLFLATSVYNGLFMHGFENLGRMIEGVNQMAQLKFIFSNIPRYLAILLGTLYENNFFLFQTGMFGASDTGIVFVSTFGVVVLFFAATLSVHEKSSLSRRSAVGLFLLALAYAGLSMTGLYLTYTPLMMARVIGLQARYFLPVFLMLFILVAALLSAVIAPTQMGEKRAQTLSFSLSVGFGIVSALLLFQTYFVGPVTLVSAVA